MKKVLEVLVKISILKKTLILVLMIFSLLINYSCKSVKVLPDGSPIKNLNNKNLISKINELKPKFKNFRSNISVNFQNKISTYQVNLNLRIIDNEAFWISANMLVPIAKLLITDKKIKFFEKFQKNFFEEDLENINTYFGFNIKFETIKNLFIGSPLSDFEKFKFDRVDNEKFYKISYLSLNKKFNYVYSFDPKTFLMNKQVIDFENSRKKITIKYLRYQKINYKSYPKIINITYEDGNEITKIELNFEKIDLPKKLNIPFKIPEGYNKLILNDLF
tara:strand:+ start:333 stop:1160 length:828 start_codon:yes stop_codon:yes gene_type:complete